MTRHAHRLSWWQRIVRRWQADYDTGYAAGYRHADLEDPHA